MLDVKSIDLEPDTYLRSAGEVFAVFDTQDSGNISYGVRIGDRRYFVKTSGHGTLEPRIALLRNAIELAATTHPTMPVLHRVIESPAGPMLVYDWFDGEPLHARAEDRGDPASAYQRFRALPAERIVGCLDAVLDLHVVLARGGWIAGDFYDGAMLYRFSSSDLRVIDLDSYHRGPLTNTVGRMFGSTRFMAPEEFERGAVIDERTTVFTLGRAAFVFLGEREAFRGSPGQLAAAERACEPDRAHRFATVAELVTAWQA